MSNKQLRTIIRWIHVIGGVLLVGYIYSPSLAAMPVFVGLIQFLVVPLLILSGVALWQQPRLNKLLKGRTKS